MVRAVLAVSIVLSSQAASAQVRFEQAVADLASPDRGVRLRSVQMLKDAAYDEAAVPLAALVADPEDAIQLEAIAAELNIFLAEKTVTRKRVGFVVEVRSAIAAEASFSAGRTALGPQPVPAAVLDAVRGAIRDDNPRVGLEALYAFGTLAAGATGADRRAMLRAAGPEIAALVGALNPAVRFGAVRVMGRLFARRTGDEEIDHTVGDAVIVALNDADRTVRSAATAALGAMRYDRAVAALGERFAHYAKGDEAAAALDAIARIANPATAALLSAQLASPAPAFRGIAVEGLARLGNSSRLAEIQAALGTERAEGVLLAGAFAAALLGGGGIGPITEAVTKPRLREQARGYLIELAPGRTPLFTPHVEDPDARTRLAIVDALGVSDDRLAIPLVEKLAGDADPLVARAAGAAVLRLRAVKPAS